MSIASEIERLYGARGDILQAIADKGVTVPSGSKLDDAPGLIAAISGGGVSFNALDYVIGNLSVYTVRQSRYIEPSASSYRGTLNSLNVVSIDGLHDFEIKVRARIVNYTEGNNSKRVAVLGYGDTIMNNYLFPSIQYAVDAMTIWFGLPDDTYSRWNASGWIYVGNLKDGLYHEFSIKYSASTGAAQCCVDNAVVYTFSDFQLPAISQKIAFGRNYDGNINGIVYVDLWHTFVKYDNALVWGCDATITGGGGGFATDSVVTIVPINKMVVVDPNGYIGYDLTDYVQTRGATFYYNYAILSAGDDFSSKGLGQVTLYTLNSNNIGGRIYNTVVIGGKEWMAENLDFKFTGLAINPDGSPSTPAAWYYDRNEAMYGIDGTRKCGLLYNWHAVKYLEDNKATIIPGWHVPTDAEWSALITAVGNNPGTKLKSTTEWTSGNGTDNYGFTVYPAGRYYASSFSRFGTHGCFWSATDNFENAYNRLFSTNSSVSEGSSNKTIGYSVRLVKDVQ